MDEQVQPTKFAIVNGSLVTVANSCTCGSYTNLYPHEPYCGYELVCHLNEIEGFGTLSDNLKTSIYMAIGEASTCWIPDTGSAVFDSTRAEKIANKLIEKIEKELRSDV